MNGGGDSIAVDIVYVEAGRIEWTKNGNEILMRCEMSRESVIY